MVLKSKLCTHCYNVIINNLSKWSFAPQKVQSYLDMEAEEEAGLVAFAQPGKQVSCLPVQAEAGCPKSPQVEQLCESCTISCEYATISFSLGSSTETAKRAKK